MFNARHTTPDGWRTDQLHVTATTKGRPRVTICIGETRIQLEQRKAMTLINEIADLLERR